MDGYLPTSMSIQSLSTSLEAECQGIKDPSAAKLMGIISTINNKS